MRSSKSRSRSKSNRNRPSGNIVNRVFDSSGPEGKVRGTPQQIIDKYLQLTRDAQLSNDRVAAENFQQHAEHYTRMLGEAQREQDVRREQQEREQDARREQQQEREGRDNRDGRDNRGRNKDRDDTNAPASVDAGGGPQPDIIDTSSSDDSGLVETPESKPAPRPKRTRAKKPPAEKPDAGGGAAPQAPDEAAE